MKTVNIKKGVNLRLIEGEKFGYTTLSILFRQMANKDKATSNSLLSLMFLSGSSKYKNRRLIEIAFEELEGAVIDTNVIKKGNEHIIQIYAKFKKEYTLEIFDILNDIIFKPLFKNEHIEKRILKNLILSQINNKRQYAFNSFLEKNYGDINGDGYIDMIDEVDIFKEYKFLIENSIVEIMAVGGNYDLILEGVKKFPFSQRRIDTIPLKKLQPVKKEYIEESNVIQAKLCVGLDCDFVCKGEEYAKLLVANDIFGSGSTSRLFMEAREGESLCYYISSRIFRFSSLIGIEAGIDEKNKDKVIEIINNALYSMKNESPTNEEINLSKINIISSYKSLFDKPEGLMNFWLNQIMANDNRNINEVINCIENINDIKGAFDNFKVASFYMLRGGL